MSGETYKRRFWFYELSSFFLSLSHTTSQASSISNTSARDRPPWLGSSQLHSTDGSFLMHTWSYLRRYILQLVPVVMQASRLKGVP